MKEDYVYVVESHYKIRCSLVWFIILALFIKPDSASVNEFSFEREKKECVDDDIVVMIEGREDFWSLV